MPTKTETTYTQDIVLANALITEAENHLAELQRHDWRRHMEGISMAGLDSSTLSHAADLNDSFEEQIKAAQKTIDQATAFRDSLVRTHGAGHEYHSTTEGGGAEKSYLTE